MNATILLGDLRERLTEIESASVRTCVTSPPYFGLRDYGHIGQLGLEASPIDFVETLVKVLREVRRVLTDDGTLWLNLGDSYAGSGKGRNGDGTTNIDPDSKQATSKGGLIGTLTKTNLPSCYKPKDMIGIPWLVAFALRDDGWYLRQDIIWAKPNPMPESVTDRCTKSHEYLFLLSKSQRYFYDADAIAEPLAQSSIERLGQDLENQKGSVRVPGKTNGNMKAVGSGPLFGNTKYGDSDEAQHRYKSGKEWLGSGTRNKRDVWNIPTQSFTGAHFAVMPEALVEPCVLAGSAEGDTVLDPFAGSGTVGVVATRHMRNFIGCELNPDYAEMAMNRIKDESPMFNECVVA